MTTNDIDSILNEKSVTTDEPENTLQVKEGVEQTFTIAFNGNAFGLPNEGLHLARIDSIELKESNAGQPYLNFKFVIADGEFENTFVWHIISLTPKASGFYTTALKAIGIDTTSLNSFKLKKNPQGFITNDELLNKLVCIDIKHKEYQGLPQAKVNKILPKEKAPSYIDDDLPIN